MPAVGIGQEYRKVITERIEDQGGGLFGSGFLFVVGGEGRSLLDRSGIEQEYSCKTRSRGWKVKLTVYSLIFQIYWKLRGRFLVIRRD